MAWSGHQIICKNHPNQIPQPGVCPSCLRERLSRIATGHSRTNYMMNSSSSSYSSSPGVRSYYYNYYSASASSGSNSPTMTTKQRGRSSRHRRHQRVASDVLDSIYLAMKGSNLGLKKSRSIAFATRNRNTNNNDINGEMKKKKGFWNKLLHRSSTVRKTKI